MMSVPLPTPFDGADALRPFERIRLVAIDVDGTLAENPQQGIGDVLRHLGASLNHHTRKVRIVIATGRTYLGVTPVLQMLGISGPTPLVLYNGAVTTNAAGNELFERRVIPGAIARSIVQDTLGAGCTAFLYECEPLPRTRGRGSHAFAEYVTGYSESETSLSTDFNGHPIHWERLPNLIDATAILIPHNPRANPALVAEIVARFMTNPLIDITTSSGRYIEIRPAGASKSRALSDLTQQLGISPDGVLAIGDNDNDADMLAWAGIGVAVANCSPAAAEASDFVAEAIAGEGVVEVLRLIRDARRYRPRESRL